MTLLGRTTPLCFIGRAYVLEACPAVTIQDLVRMDTIIQRFLTGDLDLETAAHESEALIGTKQPIDRLTTILAVTDQPILPSLPGGIPDLKIQSRRKSNAWTPCEDMRLLAGLHRFGLSAWGSIARFVGNNRTKAQCCQRWCRGLDPRISKTPWTASEDEKLRDLVERFGRKQWTRIAKEMGNRCDIQCRYRFSQLQNAHFASFSDSKSPTDSSVKSSVVQQPKTVLPPIDTLIAQADATSVQATGHSSNGIGLPCAIDRLGLSEH
jgi:hypothetical protein